MGISDYNETFLAAREMDSGSWWGRSWPLAWQRPAFDPEIGYGKPVVRGTRVPVAVILGLWRVGRVADEA